MRADKLGPAAGQGQLRRKGGQINQRAGAWEPSVWARQLAGMVEVGAMVHNSWGAQAAEK